MQIIYMFRTQRSYRNARKKKQFGSRNYLEPPALFGYDRRDKAAQKGKNKSVSKSTTPLWGRKQKQ